MAKPRVTVETTTTYLGDLLARRFPEAPHAVLVIDHDSRRTSLPMTSLLVLPRKRRAGKRPPASLDGMVECVQSLLRRQWPNANFACLVVNDNSQDSLSFPIRPIREPAESMPADVPVGPTE